MSIIITAQEPIWQPKYEFPDLSYAKEIAIDCETRDPGLKKFGPGWATGEGEVIGISVATESFKNYYPIGHYAGGNMDRRQVLAWAKDQFKSDTPKVFANALYDTGWLRHHGVHCGGPWYDVQIAGPLLDEYRLSYSLENLASDYIQSHKDETKLIDAAKLYGIPEKKIKENLFNLPATFVGEYAEQDAKVTLDLWHCMKELLMQENLWSIFEMETRLLPMLVDMRMLGVRIDVSRAEQMKESLENEEKGILAELKRKTGFEVDVWSGKKLADIYTDMGLQFYYTSASIVKELKRVGMRDENIFEQVEKTFNPNIDKQHWSDVSEEILSDERLYLSSIYWSHAIANFDEYKEVKLNKFNPTFPSAELALAKDDLSPLILAARKSNRARTGFVENMLLGQARNGRIHCQLHPLKTERRDGAKFGTISGRFSSSNPNLQQVPIRDPIIGPMIRSNFLAEEGELFGEGDYSQQEPRLTVHYAYLCGLPGSEEARNFYRDNYKADYHQMIADMAGIARGPAKTVNLGLAYGMGQAKLAVKLNMDPADAKILLDQYHERVPFVKALSKRCENTAKQNGRLRTLLGRIRHFDSWEPAEFGTKERPVTYSEALRLRNDETCKGWFNKPIRRAFTYQAMNQLIQGSAADMTKKAMLDVWDAGYLPCLQVHDSLAFGNLKNEKEAAEIKEIMENAVKLEVPVRCDFGIGKNWAEAKH